MLNEIIGTINLIILIRIYLLLQSKSGKEIIKQIKDKLKPKGSILMPDEQQEAIDLLIANNEKKNKETNFDKL